MIIAALKPVDFILGARFLVVKAEPGPRPPNVSTVLVRNVIHDSDVMFSI